MRVKVTMRRNLYICVAAMLVATPAFGQGDLRATPEPQQQLQPNQEPGTSRGPILRHTSEAPAPALPDLQEPDQQPEPPAAPVPKPPHSGPQTGRWPASNRKIPMEQYSPLAASGGYAQGRMSPWQAIVNYFNPRHLNLNQIWEERRQAWLDNAANNMYFWAIFWGSLFLIVSLLCNGWQHDEISRISWAMAEDLSDALQYAGYCQLQAKNAIARYNKHVEKCNRVVEARLSGIVTPETAQLVSLKRRVDQLTADNGALQFEKARLTEELQQKALDLYSLNQRVTEAEEKLQKARTTSPSAELVARINRLQQENQQLRQRKAGNGPKAEQQAATPNNL